MRNRGHVPDDAHRKAGGLQRAQGRLPPRPRSLDMDLNGTHAGIGRFSRRALGRHLGGIRRAFA